MIALVPRAPMTRSPSQCPGTARSATSAGRVEMCKSSPTACPGPRRPGATGFARGPPAAQATCRDSSCAHPATGLVVDRLVDRLVRHPRSGWSGNSSRSHRAICTGDQRSPSLCLAPAATAGAIATGRARCAYLTSCAAGAGRGPLPGPLVRPYGADTPTGIRRPCPALTPGRPARTLMPRRRRGTSPRYELLRFTSRHTVVRSRPIAAAISGNAVPDRTTPRSEPAPTTTNDNQP